MEIQVGYRRGRVLKSEHARVLVQWEDTVQAEWISIPTIERASLQGVPREVGS